MRTFQIGGKEFGLKLLAHEGKNDYLLTLSCDQTRLVSLDTFALGQDYSEALRQQENIRAILKEEIESALRITEDSELRHYSLGT